MTPVNDGRYLTPQANPLIEGQMNHHFYDLAIRVLISCDGDQYVAHALELDLVAYGDSEKDATKELHEMMLAQMSFAAHMEMPEMVNHAAPKEYFNRWDAASRSALNGIVCPDKGARIKVKAIFVGITPEELKSIRAKRSGGFARIPESALATA